LQYLHNGGELDGGLPIVRGGVLVGLIPAPDLEFALDKLDDEEETLCLMATVNVWHQSDESEQEFDPTDLTSHVDPVWLPFLCGNEIADRTGRLRLH
jgi:chloride channel 3/4/5